MGPATAPLPAGARDPAGLTGPFWAAAREHRLVRPHCPACDRSFFTPQVACPGCLGQDWVWEPSVGRGTVTAHTVVHRAPDPSFATPYVLAVVDLDEGWSMLTNVVGIEPHEVVTGLRVRVHWRQTDDPAVVLPLFEPDRDARDGGT